MNTFDIDVDNNIQLLTVANSNNHIMVFIFNYYSLIFASGSVTLQNA